MKTAVTYLLFLNKIKIYRKFLSKRKNDVNEGKLASNCWVKIQRFHILDSKKKHFQLLSHIFFIFLFANCSVVNFQGLYQVMVSTPELPNVLRNFLSSVSYFETQMKNKHSNLVRNVRSFKTDILRSECTEGGGWAVSLRNRNLTFYS